MATAYKLGRQDRIYDPTVPHLSALMASLRKTAPIVPDHIDYTTKLPNDLGMMLNDNWGCCTSSAVFHGKQVWSSNAAGRIDTEPDINVLKLYEGSCGFDPNAGPPGENPTDQGGIEQNVLKYCTTHGIPIGSVGKVDKLLGFVEIDPRILMDVRRGIFECGFVYIGFSVPQYLMPQDAEPPTTWDVSVRGDNTIIGGHAVVLPAYMKEKAFRVISWGSKDYTMTEAFFDRYVDEVYALADTQWITATGLTPCNVSMAQLQALMQGFSMPMAA